MPASTAPEGVWVKQDHGPAGTRTPGPVGRGDGQRVGTHRGPGRRGRARRRRPRRTRAARRPTSDAAGTPAGADGGGDGARRVVRGAASPPRPRPPATTTAAAPATRVRRRIRPGSSRCRRPSRPGCRRPATATSCPAAWAPSPWRSDSASLPAQMNTPATQATMTTAMPMPSRVSSFACDPLGQAGLRVRRGEGVSGARHDQDRSRGERGQTGGESSAQSSSAGTSQGTGAGGGERGGSAHGSHGLLPSSDLSRTNGRVTRILLRSTRM